MISHKLIDREKSLKAPITAEIISQEFPPSQSYEKPEELIQEEKELMGSELMVVRYLPEGSLSDASVPYLSVTFSQPMVSVSSVEHVELDENVPVCIEPLPKKGGKFKWLGTKTLIYEPVYRFDMSTKYNVTIKAATRSKIGGILKQDVKFSFETPKLYLRDYLPKYHGSFPLNEFPIFYLEFDQEIHPESVLPFVNVDTTSEQTLKLVSNDGRSETPSVKEYILGLMKELNIEKKASNIYYSYLSKLENAPKQRHLWFTFSGQGLNQRIESLNVTVKEGVKGLEGPLPTEKPSTFHVKNYPSFTIIHSHEPPYLPMQPLSISFSNPIDLETFDEHSVKVEPFIERMELNPNDNHLIIRGKIKGNTTYKVTFNTLQDVWGQHLCGNKFKTFNIGNAAQSLQALQNGVIVLDPTVNTKPTFSVVTMNLDAIHCRVFQVEPEEYNQSIFSYNAYSNTSEHKFPGKQVLDATLINTNGKQDEPCDTDIDLSLLLQYPKENIGQLFIVVEPERNSWKGTWNRRPIHQAWIQVTKLAIDAIYDNSDCTLYYWVNSLMDGSMIKENIIVKSGSISSTPDRESGIGMITKKITQVNSYCPIVAFHGNDKCFIPDVYFTRHYEQSGIIYQIFNDRGLYKPGETVSIKGIVREIVRDPIKKKYNVEFPKHDHYKTCPFVVQDSRSSKYHSGSITLSSNGTFDFTFTIPDHANLGNHFIHFSRLSMSHSFKVQEFRTPEFNSSCNIQPGTFVVNGPPALCTTRAQYYSGGGISGGTCSYIIRQRPTSYVPPNRSGYSFGKNDSSSSPFGNFFYGMYSPSMTGNFSTFQGMTDMNGEHQIALLFEESNRIDKVPISVTIESTVQDINRQTISSKTSFVVHPCKYYCGLKFGKQFTKPNTPVMVSLLTTNINGELIENIDMNLTVTTHVKVKKGFKYVQEKVEILKKTFKSNAETPIEFPVQFETGGTFDFHVSIRDTESGLQKSCSNSLYVIGGKNMREERVGKVLQQKSLLLIPDKNEYHVGDKATILIQSQLDGYLYGLLTMSMDGIFEKPIPVEIDPSIGCTEFSFIITKDHIPNVRISVEMSGSESRVDHVGNILNHEPKQPVFASGTCSINVSRLSHELQVEVKPEKQFLTPGSSTLIQVTVRDALTQQLVPNSEVCVVAVDEAVLSLTGYQISNPLDTFITSRNASCTSRWSLRSNVFVKSYNDIVFVAPIRLDNAMNCCDISGCTENCFFAPCACHCHQQCLPQAACYSTLGGLATEEPSQAIAIRSNFNPLAVFSPKAMTDADGIATVNATLPDNLTKYRITAVALKDESHFGISESSMVSQLPLNIRPSLPRFLNFGDCAEFTCVLQNQTLIDLNVHVAIRFTNLRLLDESKRGLNVKIPALSRHELRFPMSTEKVGIARFQVGVSISNRGINFGDAVEKEIRVYTPATTEGFATYGEIDQNGNVFQPIRTPENVYSQFGGINISTSSTALSSLTDAFIYLYSYPFECCEQLASKILSIVALKDVLQAFHVPNLPSETEMNELVQKSIQILENRQYPSGGYSYWSYDRSIISPYVTCHVAHSFARAKNAGYQVNSNTISKLLNVLKTIEHYCNDYSEESIRSIKAYAYYCASLLGDQEVKYLAEQFYKKEVQNVNLEYLAWIATTLYLCNSKTANSTVKKIIETLCKKVNETAQTANFVTSYGDAQNSKLIMLHSNRRTDGICLEALITITPENTIIPKIVKGLLAHKKKGRWGNTQENSFILLALNTYFRTFEGVTPNFVTRMWLGDDYCGEQEFVGRSKDEKLLKIPMSYLVEGNFNSAGSSSSLTTNNSQSKTLIISKQGEGRLYYRIGMDYAPKNNVLEALDYGFQVERNYEHVTQSEHVKFDSERNCWRFKAGELVRVKIRVTNTSRRYHVALVDMLPSGLEAINPELKGTTSTAEISANIHHRGFYCWWSRPWYEHHNIRNERVEAFSSLLWEGIHEFNYVARATSIGSFVIPPAKAEEMYTPEIFGRSSTAFSEVYE